MNPRLMACVAFCCALVAPGLPVGAALTPEQLAQLPPPAPQTVNFTRDIKPILEKSCLQCHGHGRAQGRFRIDSRDTILAGGDSGPAIVPGNSAESLLIELVMGFDPDSQMPKKGSKLTREQIALLRAWIDQGAPWDAGVSFAKAEPRNLQPRQPALPKAPRKLTHPVDRLLAPYFAQHGVRTDRVVDDRTFARRAYLDVIGLLPPPQALEAFVADRSPDKRARLVRRLLADHENYALHWMTFWNDLLRNDYKGTGYIDGGRKPITQWLFAALETNKPYDQFVAELINPTPASEGFAKGIVWRGVVNASQTPAMQAAQNVSQVFMGVNLKCASCHDSFINDWTLADAYGMAALFADEPLEMVHCDKPTGQIAAPRFLYPQLGQVEYSTNRAERLERLAQLITQRQDGRLTRTLVNRLWQRFFGRGLVEPLDDMEQPAGTDLLDWLAEDFAHHGYNVKHLIETLLTSRAYQLPAVPATEQAPTNFVFRGPFVRRMSAEQFRDAVGALTGEWYPKPDATIVRNDGATNRFTAIRAALVAADPLQVALGRPNREQVVPARPTVATTLQALELTNGSELAGVLRRGAEKTLRQQPELAPKALAHQLWLRGLGREPSRQELQLALDLLGQPVRQDGLEDLFWALLMLPEFQLIY
ncbi:MAG: PSD1 and planctomycete cytochrome C domain-containing protein [Verrucomicrobiales bacterium]|nr:PSD1 and planctomycete cytochrome C domain-containing protein [Verrucomicrobiales bacterium]